MHMKTLIQSNKIKASFCLRFQNQVKQIAKEMKKINVENKGIFFLNKRFFDDFKKQKICERLNSDCSNKKF